MYHSLKFSVHKNAIMMNFVYCSQKCNLIMMNVIYCFEIYRTL